MVVAAHSRDARHDETANSTARSPSIRVRVSVVATEVGEPAEIEWVARHQPIRASTGKVSSSQYESVDDRSVRIANPIRIRTTPAIG